MWRGAELNRHPFYIIWQNENSNLNAPALALWGIIDTPEHQLTFHNVILIITYNIMKLKNSQMKFDRVSQRSRKENRIKNI